VTRGDIDVSGLVCIPCQKKGHTCYAHGFVDGEAQCIFCQDGEPCFYELRGARRQPGPAAPLDPSDGSALRQPLERSIKRTQRRTAKAKPGQRSCSECGCRLRKDSQSDKCKNCRTKSEVATPVRAAVAAIAAPSAPAIAAGRLSLMVTEAQLNSYLVKLEVEWRDFITSLPVELKIAIANAYLLESDHGAVA
jgi:hypothetical protein